MSLYYYNKNEDSKGNHEVHTSTCSHLPLESNRVYIGLFTTCTEAIRAVQKQEPHKKFDGCYYCSNACHHG